MKNILINLTLAILIVAAITGGITGMASIFHIRNLGHRLDALEQPAVIATMGDAAALPAKTIPLSLHPIGTDCVIVSVVPEHKGWLLERLHANGSVVRIFESDVLNECQFQVDLSARIGQDDWDALFALPALLEERK